VARSDNRAPKFGIVTVVTDASIPTVDLERLEVIPVVVNFSAAVAVDAS